MSIITIKQKVDTIIGKLELPNRVKDLITVETALYAISRVVGASFDEILESYPTLTGADIIAVLNYAKELVENQEIFIFKPSTDPVPYS